MNQLPVVVESRYQATTSQLWRALTDNEQMKEWYFSLDDFRPEVGFHFSFEGVGTTGEKFIHHCVITEVIPAKKLVHTWCYEGIDGASEVCFELFDEGDASLLKLTHSGLESFAHAGPDFRRENFQGGWTELICKRLKAFVESVGVATIAV